MIRTHKTTSHIQEIKSYQTVRSVTGGRAKPGEKYWPEILWQR